jgi:two-component system, NtrC family, nitrogen regulation sensor histidine kinase NtrY
MKHFSIGILFRVVLISAIAFVMAYFYLAANWVLTVFFGFVLTGLTANLFNYVTLLNRKMKRLFESIQYQDFAITFKADNGLGKSFQDLNTDLNAVISSFNQVRAEREATLQFIQVVVQQVNVGILSYNATGSIEIVNQAASKLLGIYRLKNLNNIALENPEAYACITTLKPGESRLLKIKDDELSFSVTEIWLRDRKIRLVAIHSIRTELQTRELDAWQNLTKVLRHEIMNSVTPIVSLAETMQDIVQLDLKDANQEAIQDLTTALNTIQRRGNGIMNFVNAYREFTTIPMPELKQTTAGDLIRSLEGFYKQKQLDTSPLISFIVEQNFDLTVDSEQIEQVLINLIKNASEALFNVENPLIKVRAYQQGNSKFIAVADNGVGIDKEVQSKIFIPFFTTKKTGSGIGLSLSRQILQLHGGSLNFYENKPNGAVFLLQF